MFATIQSVVSMFNLCSVQMDRGVEQISSNITQTITREENMNSLSFTLSSFPPPPPPPPPYLLLTSCVFPVLVVFI